eukprot:1161990-Pelagomonas_calceolata.AAC.6
MEGCLRGFARTGCALLPLWRRKQGWTLSADRLVLEQQVLAVRTGAAPVHSSLGEGNTALSPELMRAIVAQAKTYEPSVPPELTGELQHMVQAKGPWLWHRVCWAR